MLKLPRVSKAYRGEAMKRSILTGIMVCMATAIMAFHVQATDLEVKSTATGESANSAQNDALVSVERVKGNAYLVDEAPGGVSGSCPPFCINPVTLAEGVRTVDELEVIKFMETSNYDGSGMIVDTRAPDWYQRGTIPGSMNIPASVFEKPVNDAELADVLERFGAKPRHDVSTVIRLLERVGLFGGDNKTDHWDFTDARNVLLWCNDPWCGQSPRAIKALLSKGYPADRLYYYRGGMKTWQSLGLATVNPAVSASLASR